jgi:hypothetical protein
MPPRFRSSHKKERAGYYASPDIRPMGIGRELFARRKGGAEFAVEISLSTVTIDGGTFVWSAIRDIGERERSIARLRQATRNKLLALTGLVSMCAWCKRIRDEGGSWLELEKYVQMHSRARFTHCICDDCLRRLDPAFDPTEESQAEHERNA